MRNESICYGMIFSVGLIILLVMFRGQALGAEEQCLPGPYEHRTGSSLNLTEDQEQKLALIRCAYQPLLTDALGQLKSVNKQFRSRVEAEIQDEAAVREAFQVVADAEEELIVLQVLNQWDIRQILTAEQDELMQALMTVERLRPQDTRRSYQPVATSAPVSGGK